MDKLFEVHKLNEVGLRKATKIAHAFDILLSEIDDLTKKDTNEGGILIADPTSAYAGRERALVRTHLELASFYAKKAIAQLPENQERYAERWKQS